MKLIQLNWNPTNRQLRQFAVICLFALPLITWFWGGSRDLILWLAAIGAAIAVVGWFVPRIWLPVFCALTLITYPIGLVVSEIALLLIYFGVFLPIGICFKIMGRDALLRKLPADSTSYWQTKKQPDGPASYYRQW